MKSYAFFLTLFICLLLHNEKHVYAGWEDTSLSFLEEKDKRIDEKEADKNSDRWMDKHLSPHQNAQNLPLEQIPNTPPILKYDYIGFLFAQHEGFENDIWREYQKKDLISDIKIIKRIQPLTLAQRELIKRLFLSYTKPPKNFTPLEFLIFRIETLLHLGMNNDALNLLTSYQKQNLTHAAKLNDIAIKVFTANNMFEAACLENLTLKASTPLQKQIRLHCSDLTNTTHEMINHINLPQLAKIYQKALAPYIDTQERAPYIKQALKNNLLSAEQYAEAAPLINDNTIEFFTSKQDAQHRLSLFKEKLKTLNPASAEMLYFYEYLTHLKPNKEFIPYTQDIYTYFSFLNDTDNAEKWESLLKQSQNTPSSIDSKEKRKKICNLLIFPLANTKSIMINNNAEPVNDMANKNINRLGIVKETVMTFLTEQCAPEKEAVTEFNMDEHYEDQDTLDDYIESFDDREESNDLAQSVLLSIILWHINATHTQNEADLKKNVKFILQNLNKSDLNNYVFAFSRDTLYYDYKKK